MKKVLFYLIIFSTVLVSGSLEAKSTNLVKLVNRHNETLQSTDGGVTWTKQNEMISKPEQPIPSKVILNKNGITMVSYDGGKTWLLYLEEQTTNLSKVSDIQVFPNPVSQNYINVKVPSELSKQQFSISILGIKGNLISNISCLSSQNKDNVYHIQLPLMPNGVYFLKVMSETSEVTTGFVVQR